MTHHLVSTPEIADLLGVSRQRVHQLIAENEDFPKPAARLGVGRVWYRRAIERWARKHGRL